MTDSWMFRIGLLIVTVNFTCTAWMLFHGSPVTAMFNYLVAIYVASSIRDPVSPPPQKEEQ